MLNNDFFTDTSDCLIRGLVGRFPDFFCWLVFSSVSPRTNSGDATQFNQPILCGDSAYPGTVDREMSGYAQIPLLRLLSRPGLQLFSAQKLIADPVADYRSEYLAKRLSGLLHEADAQLFRKMVNNKEHCIHQLLPPEKNSTHETPRF